MAGKKENVNLDALIPREDLLIKKGDAGKGGIPISQLEVGQHWHSTLRKPYFQRETDDWSIDNVVNLIKSYLDGHLIPAIILWKAEGYIFVIDGAHRLSALMAWINNDYGAGLISSNYWGGEIPKRQRNIAEKCKSRVEKEIGPYSEIKKLGLLTNRTEQQAKWSNSLHDSIEAQWVVGDADMAKQSFLAINKRAVQIDRTEHYMIENDKKPQVIAARAIVRSARGHAFWGNFDPRAVETIENEAKLIYRSIFEPEDAEPGESFDLQPAGPSFQPNALRLSLDLVLTVNDETPITDTVDDESGDKTARVIQKTYGVVKYIAGSDAASLSLHPAVYFWGVTGNHRPAMFLAVVRLIKEMRSKDELRDFTIHRARFEEFISGDSDIAGRVLGSYGGWKKSVSPITVILRKILDGLIQGKSKQDIEKEVLEAQGMRRDDAEIFTEHQWKATKAALRHKASLETAPRCAICKARMVAADVSDDHIERRTDGGKSTPHNAQLSHHYCNHGFKEYYAQRGLDIPEIQFP